MRLQDLIERGEDFVDVESPSEAQVRFARGTQELDRLDVQRSIARAEERSGIRQEQLAQIVHDLKGPLSTIALEGTLLDHKLEQQRSVDVRSVLARIMQNVEFLDRMVHDLLDACSFDEAACELALAPVDLRMLVESVIERSVSSRDRARVFLEAPSSLVVRLDDLRIQRVVANLLSNALKYAPLTSGVVVRIEPYPDHCRVSVIDSGPGVTEQEAGYIFDKYRRTRTARVREGSGLGLYVSKQIVEAHGGRIGVDSVRGSGSRFFFELPAI